MKRVLKPTVECDLDQIDIAQYACQKSLQNKLAKAYEVKKANLELFNGCDNVIEAFFMHVVLKQKIEKCYIYAPVYTYYEQMAHAFCKQVVYINRFDDLEKEIDHDSLVIFTNPSKPDGLYYDLESLFNTWKEKDALVFLDEAFLEFTNQKSMSKYLDGYDKLYIVRSMQRFFNTQGLRVSALLSTEKNIKQLQKNLPKYRLSTLDTHYMEAILKDTNFKQIHQAVTVKNMMLLEEVLNCTGLFEMIYSTNTNMLLCKLNTMKAKKFIKQFSNTQLYMKSCEKFTFLDEYHVRFTVYSEDDIRSLVQTFQKVYEK